MPSQVRSSRPIANSTSGDLVKLVGFDLELLLGLAVQPGDELLEFDGLYAPLASTTKFDRWQVTAPHQRVRLRGRRIQDGCDVDEGEKARDDSGPGSGRVTRSPVSAGQGRRGVD